MPRSIPKSVLAALNRWVQALGPGTRRRPRPRLAVEPLERRDLPAPLYTTEGLGWLSGGSYSEATDLNELGQVVGFSDSAGGNAGVLWDLRSGETTVLPFSEGIRINELGQVSGYSGTVFNAQSYFLDPATGLLPLPGLSGLPGAVRALGLNDASAVVGDVWPFATQVYQGAYWPPAGPPVNLNDAIDPDLFPLGISATAADINNAGLIVGASEATGLAHWALWVSGGTSWTELPLPAGYRRGVATAVNDLEEVAGWFATDRGVRHAFLWSGGSFRDVGGPDSTARDVNNLGQVVGVSDDVPFVWNPGTQRMDDLNQLIDPASGWTIVSASAINDKGQIAGVGYGPSGDYEAILLTPIPLAQPDLVPSLGDAQVTRPTLHKLLYRGQSLSVPVAIEARGAAASGDVQIDYYLSTDASADPAALGTPLPAAAATHAINLPAEGKVTVRTTVTIPPDLQVGTYYLKARVRPTGALQDADPGNNVAVSGPLTVCSATDGMTGERAARYEFGVKAARGEISDPATDPANVTDVKVYIKRNEEPFGYRSDPYLDQRGVPTVGWGLALVEPVMVGNQIKTDPKTGRIEYKELKSVENLFKELDKTLQENGGRGLVDPRDPKGKKKLTYKDAIEIAFENGKGDITDPAYQIKGVTREVADAWFDAVFDRINAQLRANLASVGITFDQLGSNVQIVLQDMAYNMGAGFVFTFPAMIGHIKSGDMACAGFELMNSDYATQVQKDRAVANFRLLVLGFEGEL